MNVNGLDPHTLRTEQYRNGTNLSARAQLHIRYSTNPQPWQRWVFDQLDLPPRAQVLELGCGPGWLWQENLDRIPADWTITLSDFSPGMIMEAQINLRDSPALFHFEVIDAQAIPHEDRRFDAIIANHMLYHVPNRAAAFAEIQRVLKPGGHFYAGTNGIQHMREMRDVVRQFDPDAVAQYGGNFAGAFTLENGRDQLARWFPEVNLRLYKDALHVDDVGPIVAYVLSASTRPPGLDARIGDFMRLVEDRIAAEGVFHITKSTGLFCARRG